MVSNHDAKRFAAALGLSLLLHAWLMHSHYGKGAARGGEGTILAARLMPAAAPLPTTVVDAARVEVLAPAALVTTPAVDAPSTMAPVVPRPAAAESAAVTYAATASSAAPSQPSDPTYYAAGDLDVFPKALVKPDLTAALAAKHESVAGKVRATVLIDEAGVVNAVRGVEMPTPDMEPVVRELLLHTRFTPARNKEGRIVKAQLLVALDYDTRDMRASQMRR